MARRRRRELIEADEFHAAIVSLMCVPHPDWTDWEWTWLEDESQRPSDYIYTEAERKKLAQLKILARTFTSYAGYSIFELLKIAFRYVADRDYEDEEFLNKLRAWGATDLKLRQIAYLARLCRTFEELAYDDGIHALLATAYRSDSDEDDYRRSNRELRH